MHSIEKTGSRRPSMVNISLFGRCGIMRQQIQVAAAAGRILCVQTDNKFAWARAISNLMAPDFKGQNNLAAGMPDSAAASGRPFFAPTGARLSGLADIVGSP
jgi:hypothetical protein